MVCKTYIVGHVLVVKHWVASPLQIPQQNLCVETAIHKFVAAPVSIKLITRERLAQQQITPSVYSGMLLTIQYSTETILMLPKERTATIAGILMVGIAVHGVLHH